jgi:hypothetical protein
MSNLYNHLFSILEDANQKLEEDSDDIYCDDCAYELDEEEHSEDCECSCHDGAGYFEYCAHKIAHYINLNYIPKEDTNHD